IGGALAGELVLTKQWHVLWQLRWLGAAGLVLVGLTAELYCVYQQFDAHPDKLIFGQTGVSGLRFFFWDSQVGRFLNTGPLKGQGTPTFFLHTALWAFFPWSIVLSVALVTRLTAAWRRVHAAGGWDTLSASVLTVLVFSASRFQLPHYLTILFPFWAILGFFAQPPKKVYSGFRQSSSTELRGQPPCRSNSDTHWLWRDDTRA